MPHRPGQDPTQNVTRAIASHDLTPGAIYPQWIENRVAQNQIRGVAGEPLHLDAAEWIDIGCGPICWRLPGSTFAERAIEWVPRSSGLIQIELRSGHEVRSLSAWIGVRKSDLVAKRDALDYYFCLVARDGLKLHIVPLIGQNPGCEPRSSSKLIGEMTSYHPAFSDFMRAQTSLYRRKILPRMFVDARQFVQGLYAVMSHDLVYLGGSTAVEAATTAIRSGLAEAAKTTTGRGRFLQTIEEAINRVSPLEYRYSGGDEIQFPRLTRQRLGTFSTERFFYDIVSSLVAEVLRFGNRVGARVGLGAATSVITFNAANGTLTTRVFDSKLGMARHATTGIDIFSVGAPRASTLARLPRVTAVAVARETRAVVSRTVAARRLGVDAFGDATRHAGAFGGLLAVGGFGIVAGPNIQEGTGDGGGLPPIVGPIEPGSGVGSGFSSDIENHQVVGTDDGKLYVVGDDGSIVGFGLDGEGNPIPSGVGSDAEGDTVLFGGVTVISFDDPGQQQPDQSQDPNKPKDNQEPPVDAGTPSGPTEADPTATGTPKPDDGGGGGDPDSPRFGGGLPGSRGSPPAGPPSFVGGLPSRGMGGVVTRGGGYTDPGSGDDGGGGGGDGGGSTSSGAPSGPTGASGGGFYFASGGPTLIPGGGIVDPPSDFSGGGGFQFWAGYIAPLGSEADPHVTGGAGLSGPPTARTTVVQEGVHIEMYSGKAPAGFRVDGLFSAAFVDTGKVRRT